MGKEYCVYVHTNKTNGKKYVGITSMVPILRWANGHGYRSNVLFYRAIQKYGWDGFIHEIVADGLTKQSAYETEIKLIQSMQLTNPKYGYNIDRGGNGSNRITEETRKKLSEGVKRYFQKHPEAKQKMAKRLRDISHEKDFSKGLREYQKNNPNWASEHSIWLKQYYAEHPEKGVEHSEKLKKYYAEHPELRELKSRQTKKYFLLHPETKRSIANSLHEYYQNPEVKKRKSEERKRFFEEHPEKKSNKAVTQYSLDGEFIFAFISAREAEKHTGVSYKCISSAVTGKQKTAGGYIWRYSDELQNKTI